MTLKDNVEQNCGIYYNQMPKSTLTHHLKVLSSWCGTSKDGREITFYSLHTEDFEQLFPGLLLLILNTHTELIE